MTDQHADLTDDELHVPKGVSPTPCDVPWNTVNSYLIRRTDSVGAFFDVFEIDTTEKAEKVVLDNVDSVSLNVAQAVNGTDVTGTYTVVASDYVLRCDTSGGTAFGITLPGAEVLAGRVLIFTDTGGNCTAKNVTINRAGSDTIDGATSVSITTDDGGIAIYSDGFDWFTLWNQGAGSATVSGTAADNEIARWHLASGALQGSEITVSDAGVMKIGSVGYVTLPEISAPGTPAAGTVALYTKTDGVIYIKDDAGTETSLAGGGGGGGLQLWDVDTDDDLTDGLLNFWHLGTRPTTGDHRHGARGVPLLKEESSGIQPNNALETPRGGFAFQNTGSGYYRDSTVPGATYWPANVGGDAYTKLTLSGWFYFDEIAAEYGLLAYYQNYAARACWRLYYDSGSGYITWQVSPDGNAETEIASAQTIAIDTWYHVAAWYDGTNIGISVNDETDVTTAYSSGLFRSSSTRFTVGAYSIGVDNLKGYCADVGIWLTDKSAQNRADLYNSGSGNAYHGR